MRQAQPMVSVSGTAPADVAPTWRVLAPTTCETSPMKYGYSRSRGWQVLRNRSACRPPGNPSKYPSRFCKYARALWDWLVQHKRLLTQRGSLSTTSRCVLDSAGHAVTCHRALSRLRGEQLTIAGVCCKRDLDQ